MYIILLCRVNADLHSLAYEPIYGSVRLSSGQLAFPPQFSTAIEWAGLFTRRYNCAASTAVTSS